MAHQGRARLARSISIAIQAERDARLILRAVCALGRGLHPARVFSAVLIRVGLIPRREAALSATDGDASHLSLRPKEGERGFEALDLFATSCQLRLKATAPRAFVLEISLELSKRLSIRRRPIRGTSTKEPTYQKNRGEDELRSFLHGTCSGSRIARDSYRESVFSQSRSGQETRRKPAALGPFFEKDAHRAEFLVT